MAATLMIRCGIYYNFPNVTICNVAYATFCNVVCLAIKPGERGCMIKQLDTVLSLASLDLQIIALGKMVTWPLASLDHLPRAIICNVQLCLIR